MEVKMDAALKALFEECKKNGLRCFYKVYGWDKDIIYYGWVSNGTTILYVQMPHDYKDGDLAWEYKPSRMWGTGYAVQGIREMCYETIKKLMYNPTITNRRYKYEPSPIWWKNVDEWIKYQNRSNTKLTEF